MTRLMARNSPETVETKSPTLRLSISVSPATVRIFVPERKHPSLSVPPPHDGYDHHDEVYPRTRRHEPLLQLQQLRPRPWMQGYPPLRLHSGVFFESWVTFRAVGAGITGSSVNTTRDQTGSELDSVSARHYPRKCTSRGTSDVDGGRTTWVIA